MGQADFSFSAIDSIHSFNRLAHLLGTNAVNNQIQIPVSYGNGNIRNIYIEKGFEISSWDIFLLNEYTLNKQTGEAENNSFTISYILSPEAINIRSSFYQKQIKLNKGLNIFALPGNIDIVFKFLPEQRVQFFEINISSEWLETQFKDSPESVASFISRINESKQPFLQIESGNGTEYRTAVDIHTYAHNGEKGQLYLKAKGLSLLSDFFGHYLNARQDQTENFILHKEKMLEVEKILDQHMEKGLPSIEWIARNNALSESTLKRHFKLMFGKSIYDYYLQKKMAYAKQLLMEKPLTVKEVAYRLGYEKTSNFIYIFKKFHNYSPGILKKSFGLRTT